MIFIAIGSNLPSSTGLTPLRLCQKAVAALAGLPEVRLVRASHWYRTAPEPASAQPYYVNGVAMLSGDLLPEALLEQLQQIERDAGRTRAPGQFNAARVLDLDIVDLNGLVRDRPDPILPHPRAHLRGFVLHPLADVAPDWIHPKLRQPIACLIAALPTQRLDRWQEDILPDR